MSELDWLDLEILRRLQGNSRYKFTRLARELGVSEATIRARVKSLEKRGYIERFTISLNPSKLGYGVLARIGVDVEINNIHSIVESLEALREVYLIALSTGTHDMLIDVIVRDLDELKQFLTEKLGRIEGVKNFDVSIIMEVYKSKLAYMIDIPRPRGKGGSY